MTGSARLKPLNRKLSGWILPVSPRSFLVRRFLALGRRERAWGTREFLVRGFLDPEWCARKNSRGEGVDGCTQAKWITKKNGCRKKGSQLLVAQAAPCFSGKSGGKLWSQCDAKFSIYQSNVNRKTIQKIQVSVRCQRMLKSDQGTVPVYWKKYDEVKIKCFCRLLYFTLIPFNTSNCLRYLHEYSYNVIWLM